MSKFTFFLDGVRSSRIVGALSSLRVHPRFGLSTAAMLAAGIALSTCSFAVLEKSVWRALGYPAADRLVLVGRGSALQQSEFLNLTLSDIKTVREHASCFEGVGFETDAVGSLAVGAEGAVAVPVGRVSAELADVLQARPFLGRFLRAGDFAPGAANAVVLSFPLWTRTLGGDPKALGEALEVNGQRHVVIGVMPENFGRPATAAGLWIPYHSEFDAGLGDKRVYARLKHGASLADARRSLAGMQPTVRFHAGSLGQDQYRAVLLSDHLLGQASRAVSALLAACLLVHIMACLNAGHLMLARKLGACRDLGIKLAVGCTPGGLCLEALIEALAITTSAVALSIPIVLGLIRVSGSAISAAFGIEARAELSSSVLLFALALALLSGPLCAGFAMLWLSRTEVSSLLGRRWGHRGSITSARLQDLLIVVQVAGAVVLMLGFGLMARSVYNLSRVDLGFRAERLSYFVADTASWETRSLGTHLDEVLQRIARLPSVESVGVGSTPMLVTRGVFIKVAAKTENGQWTEARSINFQSVSEGYFSALSIPLLKGRVFNRNDVYDGGCPAIVNSSFAAMFWPGWDAVGKTIDFGGRRRPEGVCTIVGVVGDARTVALASPPDPELYLSHHQIQAGANAVVYVRFRPGMYAPLKLIESTMAAVDPRFKVEYATSVDSLIDNAIVPANERARLLGVLTLLAVVLAMAGIYSSVVCGLNDRRQEIAVRLALGARATDITMLVWQKYSAMVLGGAAAGWAISAAVSPVFAGALSLYDLSVLDPAVFTVAPVISIVLVLLTILVPSVRAARVSLVDLLRGEV